jgi:TonB-dependent SusC/RagA subfamily outer membrane receptor
MHLSKVGRPSRTCAPWNRSQSRWPKRLGLALLGISTTVGGQTPESIPLPPPPSTIVAPIGTTEAKLSRQNNGQSHVSLVVRDSSLNYILRSLSQQARRAIVFNGNDARFAKRVEVNVHNKPILEVITSLLAGTGLEAVVGTDGETIVVRAIDTKGGSVPVQVGTIIGRVVDSTTRAGIGGATVSIAALKRSTTTQEDGTFRFSNVPAGSHSVSVKLLGYQTRSATVVIEANKSNTITIALSRSSTTLAEVVTTATGSQRRIDISNDVVKIDANRLMEAAPVRSMTDLLVAAQVPGMVITRTSGDPGAPARIRIGGVGSISQNNDPVVIVDGVWVKSAFSTNEISRQLGTTEAGQYLQTRLDAIDPATIETIEIVRGPAAATLYGPDAANGVILVKTKRGAAGPARWDVQFSRDWKNPVGTRAPVYKAFGHTAFSSEPVQCSVSQVVTNECVQDSVVSVSKSHPLLTQETGGFTNVASATVSGGTRQILYSLSGGLRDHRGTRKTPEISLIRARILSVPVSDRYHHPSEMRDRNLSTRFTISPRDGLDITLSLDGSQSNSREDGFTVTMARLGDFDSTGVLYYSGSIGQEERGSTTTRGLVSLVTRWNPYRWWMASTTLGIDREHTREKRHATTLSCRSGTCSQSFEADQTAGRQQSVYTIRAQSTFTPDLGWASRFLSLQPGISFDLRRQVNHRYTAGAERSGDVITPRVDIYDGPTSALAGLALNFNIRLFDRIAFDPAIRRDFNGSSALRNNAKSYPRFGTSWLVSDEDFFPKTSLLSTLRLRGAFGYASVQPQLSQLYGRYTSANVNINGTTVPSIDLAAIGNPELQPERSVEVETGFDADLLDERVMLSVTYSNKQNRNTLVNHTLAPSAGVTSPRQENIARVVNHTTSIQIVTRPIERDNLRLRVTSTVGFLRNEIKSLGEGVAAYGNFQQRYVPGYPVGGLWQRPVLGSYDANNNGIIELDEFVFGDSLTYMGSNLPRYTMGHNIEIGFLRHFTFNAFVDYKGAFTQDRAFAWSDLRGYWDINASPEEKLIPNLMARTSTTRDLQTVTELRLQSASLSVNVPPTLLRRIRAKSMQVSFQGSNLGLWTTYRGRDPGLNSTPIGERLTDSGNAIGFPRNYSLQFRVRY